MKVCKFGGSSLADAAQIRKVMDIVLADPARKIVVVSAPGKRNKSDVKVTDLLIALAKTVIDGADEKTVQAALKRVVDRYAAIAADLELGDDVAKLVETDLLFRMRSFAPAEAADAAKCGLFMDAMKAAGEDNSAKVVAEAFKKRGVDARYVSPRDTGMILEGESGNARLDPVSYKKLSKALEDFRGIAVYPGFFGYRTDGSVATFPRGGSDITGSILAAAVRADVYENFTDVDSVYPVDPRIVPEVKDGIPTMTYREMRELSYAGFGVFSDEAIYPAVQARIPINVRNTNHPAEPGTMIVQTRRVEPGTVTGIAAATGFCNIAVDKYLMNHEVGFGRRLLQILENEKVSYEHMPSGVDSVSVIVRGEKFDNATENRVVAHIKRDLAPDAVAVQRDYAVVMIVGEGLCYSAGMLAKAATALAGAGINVSMVNQGASEISIMFGIRAEFRDAAVRVLYKTFFK